MDGGRTFADQQHQELLCTPRSEVFLFPWVMHIKVVPDTVNQSLISEGSSSIHSSVRPYLISVLYISVHATLDNIHLQFSPAMCIRVNVLLDLVFAPFS